MFVLEPNALVPRLRNNFQLSIISLFGACSACGIFPFAVYRWVIGDIRVAILDSILVLGITALVLYAWRSGDVKRAGVVLMLTHTLGTMASAHLLGVTGLFWLYPVILGNFFLAGPRLATAASGCALVYLALASGGFDNRAEVFSFLATGLLTGFLSFILANRTGAQREQLERLANRDPLTGVYNRRAMGEELARAIAMRERTPTQRAGLLLIDLDHFKLINDRFGHDAGDQMLIGFCASLQASIRAVDRVFRYGGEEFVVLLPDTDRAALAQVARKILEGVPRTIKHPDGTLTVSIGAAQLEQNEKWQAWLARCDAALYRAKAAGRNCCVVDGLDTTDH